MPLAIHYNDLFLSILLVLGGIALFPWIFVVSEKLLLSLYVFFMPFIATSILNVESISFGLQPSYAVMMLLIFRFSWEVMSSPGCRARAVSIVWSSFPLILFVLSGLMSDIALLLGDHFGEVVRNPEGEWVAVEFSRLNITQFLYLLFVALSFIVMAYYLRTPQRHFFALKVYFASAVFVSLWGVLQLASYYLDIPYPLVFNNSLSWSQLYDQVSYIKRISSVAPEPSMFASYLSTVVAISLVLWVESFQPVSTKLTAFVSIIGILLMLLTTSTTAFLFFPVFLALYFGMGILNRISRKAVVSIGLVGLALLSDLLTRRFVEGGLIANALDTLWAKLTLQTFSGLDRFSSFRMAVDLFLKHPLLGIGVGTGRSMDLFSNLLMGQGLVGFTLYLLLIASLYKTYRRIRETNDNQDILILARALFISFLTNNVLLLISNPDLMHLHIWFAPAMLMALSHIGCTDKLLRTSVVSTINNN